MHVATYEFVCNNLMPVIITEEDSDESHQWQYSWSWHCLSGAHCRWKAQIFNTVHVQLLLQSSVSVHAIVVCVFMNGCHSWLPVYFNCTDTFSFVIGDRSVQYK